MSFRCEMCGQAQEPGTAATFLVTDRRDASYPSRVYKSRKKKSRSSEKEKINDPGGVGWEIVSEAMVCVKCANQQSES